MVELQHKLDFLNKPENKSSNSHNDTKIPKNILKKKLFSRADRNSKRLILQKYSSAELLAVTSREEMIKHPISRINFNLAEATGEMPAVTNRNTTTNIVNADSDMENKYFKHNISVVSVISKDVLTFRHNVTNNKTDHSNTKNKNLDQNKLHSWLNLSSTEPFQGLSKGNRSITKKQYQNSVSLKENKINNNILKTQNSSKSSLENEINFDNKEYSKLLVHNTNLLESDRINPLTNDSLPDSKLSENSHTRDNERILTKEKRKTSIVSQHEYSPKYETEIKIPIYKINNDISSENDIKPYTNDPSNSGNKPNVLPIFQTESSAENIIDISDNEINYNKIPSDNLLIFHNSENEDKMTRNLKPRQVNEILQKTTGTEPEPPESQKSESGVERTRRLKRMLDRVIRLVNVIGHIDSYLTEKIRSGIRMLSLLYGDDYGDRRGYHQRMY